MLSGGPINGANAITIELIQPEQARSRPHRLADRGNDHDTRAHYLEVAAAAMKVLAEASTTLARIKTSRRR